MMIGGGVEVEAYRAPESESFVCVFHIEIEHVGDDGIDKDFITEPSEHGGRIVC
jgi:hypothetical protein